MRACGKLHSDLCPLGELERNDFEELLAAMSRAGLLVFADAVFEKEGKEIPYRTVQLTREGQSAEANELSTLRLKIAPERSRIRKAAKAATEKPKTARQPPAEENELTKALRAWRLAEARSKSLPAFRIFSDQVLYRIAEDRPADEGDLLAIPGVGPAFIKRYGEDVLRLVASH